MPASLDLPAYGKLYVLDDARRVGKDVEGADDQREQRLAVLSADNRMKGRQVTDPMSVSTETVERLRELLRRVGGTDLPANQAALPPRLITLHQAVLRAFLDDGEPRSEGWLHEQAEELGLDPQYAVARLAASDLVHVSDGKVVVAYPFSGTPTRHQVQLDGGPSVYAVCGGDAVGIPLMAGRDGVIASTDPGTGEPIHVEWRGGAWSWDPEGAVMLVAGANACGTAAENACGTVGLYTHAEHARTFLRDHSELDGEVLDQATTVAFRRDDLRSAAAHRDPWRDVRSQGSNRRGVTDVLHVRHRSRQHRRRRASHRRDQAASYPGSPG
jgi:hypothetical protein